MSGIRGRVVATLLSAVVATSVAACRPNATAFYVEVNADLSIRRDLRMVRVKVFAPPTDSIPLQLTDYVIGADHSLPLTFNIVSRTPDNYVRIEIDGYQTQASSSTMPGFVRARVITNFSAGKTLYLPLNLAEVCRNKVTTCEDPTFSKSCDSFGQCNIADIDKSTLAQVDPQGNILDAGRVATTDAGVMDTGTPDTGTPDTGTPDTGTPDTGTPDTGVRLDAGTMDTGAPADAAQADVPRG